MRYQVRLVLDNGRVIPGPIFPKARYQKFQEVIDHLHEYNVLRWHYGSYRVVIPEEMLKRSHGEIRRIGLIRRFIAWWRS